MTDKMVNVVLDIETLDNRPTAAIIAIGAAGLNAEGAIVATFYTSVNAISCQQAGLTLGADTVLWWMQQSEEARGEFTQAQQKLAPTIRDALQQFSTWCAEQGVAKHKLLVWGNGSDFDNVVMKNAYDMVCMEAPWMFWNNRCFRTLKNMMKEYVEEPVFDGEKHQALYDAIHEAKWLAAITRKWSGARYE